MKKIVFIVCSSLMIWACGGSAENTSAEAPAATTESTASGNPSYDPNRGSGKFKDTKVSTALDVAKATAGEKVYNVKCSSCHKLTEEKLVGPGWKGVTSRYSTDWILNFVTNTDEMLNMDPKAQAQLEICLVRMPNQNLSDDDAMGLYEFMRKNDGTK